MAAILQSAAPGSEPRRFHGGKREELAGEHVLVVFAVQESGLNRGREDELKNLCHQERYAAPVAARL